MKKFETIDNIVTDILSSIGDGEYRGHTQMARIVLRTLDGFHYNIKPTVKSGSFTVEDNNTILYPDDAYKVVNAGKCLDNGVVMMLGKIYESPITKEVKKCTCDACSGTSTVTVTEEGVVGLDDVCPTCTFFNYYEGNHYKGELYGLMHEGFPYGRYFDNEEESRIEFNNRVKPGDTIVLKYMIAVDKNTHDLVPVEYYELIRTKSLETFFQSSNPRKANEFRGYYRRELRLLKRRINNHRLEDYIDAITTGRNNAVN